MNTIKPEVIGYIQLDLHTSECPMICYGLMSKEYMEIIVDCNHKRGYITRLRPVYKIESVYNHVEQIIEEW